MPDDLYERDVLTWSEQQAGLLRRLAAGERVNDAVDWANVIEEVGDVGISQVRACRSQLLQAILRLLELHRWPRSQGAAHWRSETVGFLTEARVHFTPSMRRRIDMRDVYADALYRLAEASDDSGTGRPVPPHCPFEIGDLVAVRPDIVGLLAALEGRCT